MIDTASVDAFPWLHSRSIKCFAPNTVINTPRGILRRPYFCKQINFAVLSLSVFFIQHMPTCYRVARYAEKIIRNVHTIVLPFGGFPFVVGVVLPADGENKECRADCSSLSILNLWLTPAPFTGRRKGGAGQQDVFIRICLLTPQPVSGLMISL